MSGKSILALCLAFLLAWSSAVCIAESEFDASDHYQWMQKMVFGDSSYAGAGATFRDSGEIANSSKPIEVRIAATQLHDAILLCLDQFNSYYGNLLAFLNNRKYHISGLPASISAINFTASSKTHRIYTHRGWRNPPYSEWEKRISHPEIRSQILTSVVDHVFSFGKYTKNADQAKKLCDAMCCYLYCTHIITDRYHSKEYYGAANYMLLAEKGNLARSGNGVETVMSDLLYCLPILFTDQKKNRDSDYNALIRELESIESNIVREQNSVSSNNNDGLKEIDRKYSNNLKETLSKYVPDLLYQQSWFVHVFPEKWSGRQFDRPANQ